MKSRVLSDEAVLAEGAEWLARCDTGLRQVVNGLPLPPLRRRPEGFATLLQVIVGQQVSTASAAAIWARIEVAGLLSEGAVVAVGEEGLRAVGLSAPKIRYALAIASSGMDFAALRDMADEEAVRRLTTSPGIGRWTAEVYVTTALGRADVIPAGDLALQEAARLLYGLEARPGEAALRARAREWGPWRGVAARLLWGYYRARKKREGML